VAGVIAAATAIPPEAGAIRTAAARAGDLPPEPLRDLSPQARPPVCRFTFSAGRSARPHRRG
jgi:hypothetical protein